MAIYIPGMEASGEISPANTLTSDFLPPELCEIRVCCLNLPVCGTLLQQPDMTSAPAEPLRCHSGLLPTGPAGLRAVLTSHDKDFQAP